MIALARSGLHALFLVLALLGLAMPAGAQEADPQAALAQLLEVLRDDTAREALIAELEAAQAAGGETAGAVEFGVTGEDLRSFGAQLADLTLEGIGNALASGRALLIQLAELPAVFAQISASDFQFAGWLAGNLAILVAVTYGGLLLMGFATDPLRRRLRVTVRDEGLLARTAAVLATLAIDVLQVLVPWAVGYGAALVLLGEPGDVA